jgi:hypothetical protein
MRIKSLILLLISFLQSQEIANNEIILDDFFNKNFSTLELMFIASINKNTNLESDNFKMLRDNLKLSAPTYDRFDKQNNQGIYFPYKNNTSIYLDFNIKGYISANKYILENNLDNSSSFFKDDYEKFTYFNTRKGYIDSRNYFRDSWDQKSFQDYINHMYVPPFIEHQEMNTIYDSKRSN